MESVKPVVEETLILALLKDAFKRPVQELMPVQDGLIAQTLSFRAGDEEYILAISRFSSHRPEGWR